MNANKLHEQIEKVVPITGVSVGKADDKSTWRVSYTRMPTAAQLKDVTDIIAAFDTTPEVVDNKDYTLEALVFILERMNLQDDAAIAKRLDLVEKLKRKL